MSDSAKKPRAGWYVVQVSTGAEERLCALIRKACEAHDNRASREEDFVGLEECFTPRFVRRRKRMGEWKDVHQALLPGYVIADVKNPVQLADALRSIREFCSILSGDETYSPLNDTERRWLEMQTEEDRTIPLSFGIREQGKITVLSGPLKGNEAMITSIDRRNCIANVELHAGQITLKTTVGLAIMPNGEVVQA